MNKYEADYIAIHLKNGIWIQAAIDGTYSKSDNSRKLHGIKNAQTWTEYFVSWIEYDDEESEVEELKPVGKADRETLRGKAWCSQHNCEPSDCFKIHNPTAFSGRTVHWESDRVGMMKFAGELELEMKKVIKEIKKESVMEEFDISDLLGGYGNGNSSL